jgi:hypothetical protein
MLAASFIRAMITLIMEAASTSETSVNFYQTTRRNNPEDSHLQNMCFITYVIRFVVRVNIIHLGYGD